MDALNLEETDPKLHYVEPSSLSSCSEEKSDEQLTKVEQNVVALSKYHSIIDQVKNVYPVRSRHHRLAGSWCIALKLEKTFGFASSRNIFMSSNMDKALLALPSGSNQGEQVVKQFVEDPEHEAVATFPLSKQELVLNTHLVAEAFEVHLRIKDLINDSESFNEWTLINQTISLLVEKYTVSCCRSLWRVQYDKVEHKGKIRPDLKISLRGAHPFRILLCEVALEELDFSVEFTKCHKGSMKLPTSMRTQLEAQLKRVPTRNAGVFGILMGKFNLRIIFMNAQRNNANCWAFIVNTVSDISLLKPSGLVEFMQFMASLEAFAIRLSKVISPEEVNHVFPARPEDFEPGRSSASSSTPSPKDQKKKSNKTNESQAEDDLPSDILRGFRDSLSCVRSLDEENQYIAQFQHGKETLPVFIVTKTARDVREVEFLKGFDHRCVLKLLHYEINRTAEDSVTYTMVLPLLEEFYFVPRGVGNHLKFAFDILCALNHIHSHNVVHRDLKPSNIGLANNRDWILFDFNTATRLKPEQGYKSFSEGVGTEGWQAPEVIKVDPEVGYDFKADIYSFGLVLRYMCRKAQNKHHKAIRSLIDLCLKKDPAERPTARELMRWVKRKYAEVMAIKDKKEEAREQTAVIEEVAKDPL